MAKEDLKKSSVSLIQYMPIDIIMKYHHTPTVWLKLKMTGKIKCYWGFRANGTHIFWWEGNQYQCFRKHFVYQLRLNTMHTPRLSNFTCSTEMCTYLQKKACARMFVSATFLIVKNWKKLTYPSAGEMINKRWYVHIMKYYYARKMDSYCVQQWVKTWMNLRNKAE